MQFSDTINLQGLIQDIDFRCSTNDNKYPIKDKTRNLNNSYDKVINFIILNSGKIKPADTNTTAPYNLADYNLADGVNLVPITEVNHFRRAEVKDENGVWTNLKLIEKEQISSAVQEFFNDDGGIPRYISIEGDSATLYPTPNYTKTDGLRIYDIKRTTLFDSTDTTAEPQIPRLAHTLLSIEASLAYCSIYKQDRVNTLKMEKLETEKALEMYLKGLDNVKSIMRGKRVNAK